MEIKVYTNLDVVTEAWNILDEIGLAAMLDGGEIKIEVRALLNKLLKGGQLKEFLAVITKDNATDWGALSGNEIIEVIGRFFSVMGSDWSALPGLVSSVKQVKAAESSTGEG